MIRKWDSEKIEYLKQICPGRNEKEIADMINKKFNTTFTKSAINSIKSKHNIKSKKVVRVYTDEVVEFIINNYQGKDNIELAELVNKQFNLNVNVASICNFKGNIKRRKGINLNTGINRGCIKKGNIPMNKGKKWSEYMSEEGMKKSSKTWYKKGNISSNAAPIGTEKIKYSKSNKDDGYICIKVCDGKKQKNWIPKHRLIYEQHYGKIPAGHKVIFADGNKENFDIDNLILVKNSEELIMNRRKLIFDNKELTKTGANIAKVLNKAYERKKGL